MKKILSLCLAALLACLFLLPAAAEEVTVTGEPAEPGEGMRIILDKTYTHLYYDDAVYSRADISRLSLIKESRKGADVGFEEYNGVEGISLWATRNNTVFWIDVSFTDGSNITATFLRDSARTAYERLLRGEPDKAVVDFNYPIGNEVNIKPAVLRGESVSLEEMPAASNCFYIRGTVGDGDLQMKMGFVAYLDGEFYYVSFDEVGDDNLYDILWGENPLPAYRITDAETCAALLDAWDAYLGDEMGFVYDDSLTGLMGTFTLIVFFCAIPLALFVVFLVLAIRSRGVYRKIHTAICTCSGVTLAIFCIVAIWVGTI
ncbi:MAG: hypothetical protein E7654_08345 [Ruminococcaceae bacterium]|nr:hypothetical protein [Oscillospiraceae bacterium]